MATESFWGGTDKAAYKFRCPIYSRNQPKVEKGCHRQRMFGVLDLYICVWRLCLARPSNGTPVTITDLYFINFRLQCIVTSPTYNGPPALAHP